MSSLFSALQNAAQALGAFDRAIGVTQNNVNNASAPGYARQKVNLDSLAFQPGNGLWGGVKAGDPTSTRDPNAERGVWEQTGKLGTSSQLAASLGGIEGIFDLSGKTGLPAALNQLFQSFSAWSVTPNSATARQAVLANAGSVAASFQQAAASLSQATTGAGQQIRSTVDQINALAAKIQDYNSQRLSSAGPDAGQDAGLHNTLESLSHLVNFQALYQADGTVTVLAGGQSPLVIGDHSYPLHVDATQTSSNPAFPNGVPPVRIVDANGQDATGLLTQGTLGGLLQFRNSVLASLQGDGNQQGAINILAQKFADRVNSLLTSGVADPGPPVVNGTPLFVYDATSPGGVASSLSLNPKATADTLAPADPGPPPVANGIALKLAALSSSSDPADQINNQSYTAFFGAAGAQIGQITSDAQATAGRQEQMVASAKALRSELSGVSLDDEAVQLVQYQRSYQASARMVTVIDQLTSTILNMIP